jgi:hypothetical protein
LCHFDFFHVAQDIVGGVIQLGNSSTCKIGNRGYATVVPQFSEKFIN